MVARKDATVRRPPGAGPHARSRRSGSPEGLAHGTVPRVTASPLKRPSFGYRMTRHVARLLLRMEYRRFEVSGAEHVPATGAVLLVANHHNSLVDSMAILAASPRIAGPMAKAPLWKNRILRPFLDAVEALPVFRPQDAAENAGKGARANLETFAECIRRLKAGRSLVLFPEGMSRPSPKLLPLRTGAARIALDAEVPVFVVPIGLLHEPPAKRRGTLLVRFGPPFVLDGREAGDSRRSTVSIATRRMEVAIRALLAEADSLEDVELLHVGAAVISQTHGTDDRSLADHHALVRRLATGFEELRRSAPAEREALRADAAAYARHLALLDLPIELLEARYGFARVARFVGGTVFRLVIGSPIALLAGLVTAPARVVGDVVALRGGEATEDVLPFARILGRTFFLFVEAILAAIMLAIFVGPLAAAAALVGIPLLYAVHVVSRDWRTDVAGRVRAFFLLAGGRLRRELRAERAALAARIEKAGASLPGGTGDGVDAPE